MIGWSHDMHHLCSYSMLANVLHTVSYKAGLNNKAFIALSSWPQYLAAAQHMMCA